MPTTVVNIITSHTSNTLLTGNDMTKALNSLSGVKKGTH